MKSTSFILSLSLLLSAGFTGCSENNNNAPDISNNPSDITHQDTQCQAIAYKILSNNRHEYIDEISSSEYKVINSKDEWNAFTETNLFSEGVAQKDELKAQVDQINFENTMLIYMRARSGSDSMKFVIDKACDHDITAAIVWCAGDGGDDAEYLNTMILSAPKDTYNISIARSHEVSCD